MKRSTARVAPAAQREETLWVQFKGNPSRKNRELLFMHYLPFAKRLAWHLHRDDMLVPCEIEELVQLASTGLLEAIDRFKPELGVPFRYFGNRRIRGSILNGLAVHSEVAQQISFRKRVERERLASLKAEGANSGGLAEALDVLSEVATGLAMGLLLEEARLYSTEDREPSPNAYETLAWKQLLQRVNVELNQLSERDQAIVQLHYFEGLTFDRVAEILGLSRGRVSQIHKAAIALLRKRLLQSGQFRLSG